MTTVVKVGIALGVVSLLVITSNLDQTTDSSLQNSIPTSVEKNISVPIQAPVVPKTSIIPKAPEKSSNCHPSYSGCLNPNASDYDCAGGSGNGPYYTGTVRVIGSDVFGLDRDGDGWGCD